MLMSDNDCTEAKQIEVETFQPAIGFPHAETAVDQNMGMTITDNSAIPTAATSEGSKPQHAVLNQVAADHRQHPLVIGKINSLTTSTPYFHDEIVALWI